MPPVSRPPRVASASGTLAATPLAHALVYARNRRLSGAFELRAPGPQHAVLTLWCGKLASVRTMPTGLCPGGYLGAILYERGLIDAGTLDATLLEVARTKRLHGQILVERGSITPTQRDEALAEQICRKAHHLFSFPPETAYAFYDIRPSAQGPQVVVDALGPVWRGIRDYPPTTFITEAIRRVANCTLKMTNESVLDRGVLPAEDAKLCELLANHPMTLVELRATSGLSIEHVDRLIYLLVISKCVEPTNGMRATPSIGQLPVTVPSGRMPAVSPVQSRTISAPQIASGEVRRTGSSGSHRAATVPPVVPATPPVPLGPTELSSAGIVVRANAIDGEDAFQILGVPDGASAEAVRAMYFRLAKLWHPDRIPPELEPLRLEITKIFSNMTRAYQLLSDPIARKSYLAERNAGKPKRDRADVVRTIDVMLSRSDFVNAELEARSLAAEDSDDAEALALEAWAGCAAGAATDDTLRAAAKKLDRAVHLDNACERAYYYRGVVSKRLGNPHAAFRDFARVVALDPRHIEAQRELRLFEMRAKKGGSGEHMLGLDVKKRR